MRILLHSFKASNDVNGNPRHLIQAVFLSDNQVTNIRWFDIGYKWIPRNTKDFKDLYMDFEGDADVELISKHEITKSEYKRREATISNKVA